MKCDDAQELLIAYIDNELPLPDQKQVAAHIARCSTCAAVQSQLLNQSSLIKASGRYRAPPGLQSKITADLDRITRYPSRHWRPADWLAFCTAPPVAATVSVMAALATVLLVLFAAPRPTGEAVIQEMISAHVRSLLIDNLVHVASSDRHTVKPWFQGKLDYAPPVKDLSEEDIPLLGGRLDYVGQRPVAAVVYRRRQHLINYFVWPIPGVQSASKRALSQQGYQVVNWSGAGLEHWLVSDLNGHELMELANHLGLHRAESPGKSALTQE